MYRGSSSINKYNFKKVDRRFVFCHQNLSETKHVDKYLVHGFIESPLWRDKG